MNGSQPYLGPLESFRTMLTSYPTRAEIDSIRFAVTPNQQGSIIVRLRRAEPAILTAGLVDWQRTLSRTRAWAWRTRDSDDVHVAVVGFGTECDRTPVIVVGGPVPHDRYLDEDIEPGSPEALSNHDLHAWLGAEITRVWPFTPQGETP
jgi:hypothetical protein